MAGFVVYSALGEDRNLGVNFAMAWLVYIIKKRDLYYTGITTDLQNRLRQHGSPQLLYKEIMQNRRRAVAIEKEIKGWSRKKKENLIAKFTPM
ncbi:MAG: GIY-YIG nuclease family protein [bacterium]|nr:GIY-YIG nuclease family protein [bacterium]